MCFIALFYKMKFCPQCERVMRRDMKSSTIKFICACGMTVNGNPNDAYIAGAILKPDDNSTSYTSLINTAAFDPVNKKVKKDCAKCGLDFMTQIYIGASKTIVYICICGHNE